MLAFHVSCNMEESIRHAMTEASFKRPCILWLPLKEMFRTMSKGTESRLVLAESWSVTVWQLKLWTLSLRVTEMFQDWQKRWLHTSEYTDHWTVSLQWVNYSVCELSQQNCLKYSKNEHSTPMSLSGDQGNSDWTECPFQDCAGFTYPASSETGIIPHACVLGHTLVETEFELLTFSIIHYVQAQLHY